DRTAPQRRAAGGRTRAGAGGRSALAHAQEYLGAGGGVRGAPAHGEAADGGGGCAGAEALSRRLRRDRRGGNAARRGAAAHAGRGGTAARPGRQEGRGVGARAPRGAACAASRPWPAGAGRSPAARAAAQVKAFALLLVLGCGASREREQALRKIDSPVARERAAAVRALGSDDASWNALAKAVRDGSPAVRSEAAAALARSDRDEAPDA